jgi:hypothetical protein
LPKFCRLHLYNASREKQDQRDRFFNDLVADASNDAFVHGLARRDDKLITFFKLLDRRWWMPGGFHAFVVSNEIRSLNFTKSFPEMRKDF